MKIEASQDDVNNILDKYKTIIKSNNDTGELVFAGIPVMFSRAQFMSNIFSELEGIVGESATGILKKIGKSYGELFYDLLYDSQHSVLEGEKEKIFNYLCAETQAIGWGRISIEELSGKIIISSEEGMATGRNYSGQSQGSVDSYFLGYFEGFFSKLNKTPYHGTETECVAKGDKHCKMEFGTEPVF